MSAEDVGMSTERLERVGAMCRRYVDTGRLPCTDVQIARRGQVVYRDTYGSADLQADRPLADDTIFRIYSMTKPITSIALMQLYEQGEVLLENRVDRFIPEFGDVQVWTGGTEDAPQVRPPSRPITVHDVLTHMSGLTYGFMFAHPVDAIYRHNDLGNFTRPDISLAESDGAPGRASRCQFDPGSRWNYSMSTDVCGRIVEVVSGMTLDAYLDEHIFGPLGMVDTGFWLNDEQLPRLAACYTRTPETPPARDRPGGQPRPRARRRRSCRAAAACSPPPPTTSGSATCSSTEASSTVDRIIGPRTLDYMTSNHLPGNATLNEMGQVTFSEATMEGTGFGLGFSVLVDPAANQGIGIRRRVRLGWRGQHHLLDRSGRGAERHLHDPAAAVQHLSDPPVPEAGRAPGADRLRHRRSATSTTAADPMSGIACGHCGGRHPTVAEVRSCSADHPADPALFDTTSADPRQLAATRAQFRAPRPRVRSSTPTPRRTSRPPELSSGLCGREFDRGPRRSTAWPGRTSWAARCSSTDDADPSSRTRGRTRRGCTSTRPRPRPPTWPIGPGAPAPGPSSSSSATCPPPDPVVSCRLDQLSPDTELPGERLRFALLANSVDGRDPDAPRFAPLEAAVALGATVGGPGDVETPDGIAVLCDGGPLGRSPPTTSLPVVPMVHLERGALTPLTDHPVTADLADDQLAAVAHRGGGARIIAPAGSGQDPRAHRAGPPRPQGMDGRPERRLPRRLQRASPSRDGGAHHRPVRTADPHPQQPGAGHLQRHRAVPAAPVDPGAR